MYTDGSVTKGQSGWGLTVKEGGTTINDDSATCTVSTSSLTMEVEAVTHALRWIASRGDSRTTYATILTDSMNLLQKVKSGVGNPDWHVSLFDIHLRKLLWVSCLTERKSPVRLAGKAALTNGLRPGRSEVLRSLRHFLQGTKPRTSHHRSSGGERRGKKKHSMI